MLIFLAACLVNADLYERRRLELLDHDGDGHIDQAWPHEGGDDCDDDDPEVFPGQAEVPYDGVDNDCDPQSLDDDLDGDGHPFASDCDDTDSQVFPGAEEICDGIDNDCDDVDSCLPHGQQDVATAPLAFRLQADEETGTGVRVEALDFDGDGLEDLMISSPLAEGMAGRVDVVTGLGAFEPGEHELSGVARVTVLGTGGPGTLGVSAAGGCDVDGDGYGDIVVTSNGGTDGAVYVFDGGPLGVSGTIGLKEASWVFVPEEVGRTFGSDLACARINAGAATEVVIGEFGHPGAGSGEGLVWVFHGNRDGEATVASSVNADVAIGVGSLGGSALGKGIGNLGDLDGDGTEELGFSSPTCQDGAGCVWIATGLAGVLGTGSQTFLTTDDMSGQIRGATAVALGTTIRNAGDVDGDGTLDLVVAGRNDDLGTYGVWLFSGQKDLTSSNTDSDDAVAWWSLDYPGEQLSTECYGGHDVDGDTYDDVIIGSQASNTGAALGGVALLYLGGDGLSGSLSATDAWAVLASESPGGRAGASVGLLSDANGDEHADLFLGLPELGSPGGAAIVYFGGPRGQQ